MNAWTIVGIVALALIVLFFLMNVKELIRYIKIRNM